MHKLSKLQKSGFEKIAIEVVDMQTAKIQLNSGLAKCILYGLVQFCTKNNLPLSLTFKI